MLLLAGLLRQRIQLYSVCFGFKHTISGNTNHRGLWFADDQGVPRPIKN